MSNLTATLSVVLNVQRTNISGSIATDNITLTSLGYDEQNNSFISVPNASTGLSIVISPVHSGQLILIQSDQLVTFKLNGSATGIACTALMLTGAALTTLTVDNSSGNAANIRMVCLGT